MVVILRQITGLEYYHKQVGTIVDTEESTELLKYHCKLILHWVLKKEGIELLRFSIIAKKFYSVLLIWL